MANKSTVTIDAKTAETILREIEAMRKSLEALRKKILKLFPAKYGSDAWWEKSEHEADEDIKKGRVFGPFKNADELLKTLHREASL